MFNFVVIPGLNMVDQLDALLNIHREQKDIVLDPGVDSSKECSTTTKKGSYVDQSLTSRLLSVSVNPLHLVKGEILDIQSTSTASTEILSTVACSKIETLTTSNFFFFKFPRPFTIISSIPTDLRLVYCIPYSIMTPCVQPRIDYKLQFKTNTVHNIFRSTTFVYGPIIEHLKYIMKIWYNETNQTPTIDVIKITCGTQVTQSFRLKCVEKVSVKKQQNGNGIDLYYPKYNLNNNAMNETNIRQVINNEFNRKQFLNYILLVTLYSNIIDFII